MAVSSFLSKPALKVTMEQDMIFVHPSVDPAFPSHDPEVRGTVLLSLPSRRTVKSIKVVLEGLCDAYGGHDYAYESSTTLHKELDLDLEGQMLEAGNHAFNFSFIVPSSTAVYQRCAFGRVRHYIKGKAEFASGFSSSISSAPVALWISSTPSPSHEVPEPFELNIEHFSEDLGPIAVGISSPHLTVASLVYFRLGFICPSSSIAISSIQAFITQTFTVLYNDPTVVANPPPKKYALNVVDEASSPAPIAGISTLTDKTREKDPDPLKQLVVGEEWRFARLARVPNDDFVRPTTLDGTEAKIRVAHKLSVEVRYRFDGTEKVITVSKPVTIATCCCLADSLFLPAYARAAPKTVVRPREMRCLCNVSLKEMVDRDGFALQRAGSIEMPTDSRLLGVDRAQKSPAPSRDGRIWSAGSRVDSASA